MSEIIDVLAREVLDSRGNPTVEVGPFGGRLFWQGNGSFRCIYG